MFAAKFPLHRDLAGFDFDSSKVDQPLVRQLASLSFTDTAQNFVLIGGPGTGKTHLATAIAVSGIAAKGKRVRFYSTVDLVNLLERENRGRIPLIIWHTYPQLLLKNAAPRPRGRISIGTVGQYWVGANNHRCQMIHDSIHPYLLSVGQY